MKIAVAQMNTRAGDFAATLARMEAFAQSAVDQGAELVVFPMAVLTGPIPLDFVYRQGHHADLKRALQQLAETLPCPCLVPVVWQSIGDPYHEVMLIEDGKVEPLHGDTYDPSDILTTPMSFKVGELKFVAALTYEDLDYLAESAFPPDVVVYIADYAYALDDVSSSLGASLSENRFVADAVTLDSWIVAAGSFGGYGLQVFSGSSFVLAPDGKLAASAPSFEESLLVTEVTSRTQSHEEVPTTIALDLEVYNSSLHLWEALSLGLHDFVDKIGRTDVALVLDGTLATSLLAVLASDALGSTNIHALVGAKPGSAEERTARAVADALRLTCESCAVDAFALVDAGGARSADGAALANDLLQACLADVARTHDAVILDAADKTFLAVEATEHDHCVAELLPFGDVYRTDLIELAHLRNTISPVIPPEAITRFVVPGIEGLDETEATDELRLKRVDVTLMTHVEWERSLSDVVARQGEQDVTERILSELRAHEMARRLWPPCLVASTKPLFFSHMPLGYAWQDRVRSEEEQVGAYVPENRQKEPQEQGFVMPDGFEGTLNEIIGMLQDMVQSGEQPPSIEGPFGPLTWGSPFSEN